MDTEASHKLAHDLRNALSGAYMCAQMLEMSLTTLGLDKEKDMASDIQKEIKKTLELITERVV